MTRTKVVGLAALVGIVWVSAGTLVACSSDDDDTGGADAGGDVSVTHPAPGEDAGDDASSRDATADVAVGDSAANDANDANQANDGGDAGDAADASDAPQLLGKAVFTTWYPGSPDQPPPFRYSFGFVEETPAATSATCTVSAPSAACQLSICTGQLPVPTDVAVAENAGVVVATRLNDGSDAGTAKTATLDDAGFYELVGGPIFETGGAGILTLTGSGAPGGLAAFSLTVPLPGQARTTFPSLTLMQVPMAPEATTTLARQSDLPLTWTNGVAGAQVVVTVGTSVTSDAGTATKTLTCTFDQSAGSATVPSAGGLQALDAVDGATARGVISVTDYVLGSTADGPATVQASIGMPGLGVTSITFTTTN